MEAKKIIIPANIVRTNETVSRIIIGSKILFLTLLIILLFSSNDSLVLMSTLDKLIILKLRNIQYTPIIKSGLYKYH